MSFSLTERAVESTKLELYEFAFDAEVWYYNNGVTDYLDPTTGRTFTPMGIIRTDVIYSSDLSKGGLELTLPNDCPFLDLFRVSKPSGVISCSIFRVNINDVALERVQIWIGKIIGTRKQQTNTALICEPIQKGVQRFGLQRLITTSCQYTLFDPNSCRAVKSNSELTTTVEAINNNQVTIAATGTADNYYNEGYMAWSHAQYAATETGTILTNVGSTRIVTLGSIPQGLDVGAEVRLYPSCDHTAQTCLNKFSNIVNYGGFPHIPDKNLFGGDIIY